MLGSRVVCVCEGIRLLSECVAVARGLCCLNSRVEKTVVWEFCRKQRTKWFVNLCWFEPVEREDRQLTMTLLHTRCTFCESALNTLSLDSVAVGCGLS